MSLSASRGTSISAVHGLCALLATWSLQQLPNQRFEALPAVRHATVGDTVTVSFRVRLDPQDLLYDTTPRPIAALPAGVRVLSVEKLHRNPDRIYVGKARIAFFRPGRQAVPVFGLEFMRGVKGMTRGTLASDSAYVEIDPVAPPGNPALKDIREPPSPGAPAPWLLAAVLAALGLAGLGTLTHRRRRVASVVPVSPAPHPEVRPTAYYQAMTRLAEIEEARWPSRGEVTRHYAAVADAVRHYLVEAQGVGAPTLTTRELAGALRGVIAEDRRGQRCVRLLGEADLVKFARRRPDAQAAARYLRDARVLLGEWHAGESPGEQPRGRPSSVRVMDSEPARGTSGTPADT